MQLVDSFDSSNASKLVSQVEYLTKILIGIGVGAFIMGYFQVCCSSSNNQFHIIKKKIKQ